MARTQASDYYARREAFIEHAADIFAAAGFHGASMSDLATVSKVSKSLLYHYFPAKEDILYAVMVSHIDELLEAVTEVENETLGPQEQLRTLVHRFMHHYVRAAAKQKVLLNELDNLPAKRRAEIVSKQRSVVTTVAGLLERLNAGQPIDPHRLRVKAMLFLGMINWTHTWYDPSGPLGPSEVADMALDMILIHAP